MGAIIASCIACWFDSNEMTAIVEEINFLKLIDFDFKNWIIKWNKIKAKFDEIFWTRKVSQTKIPLKIVSTILDNWEKEIINYWLISDALRSSISIPWVIVPNQHKGLEYIDWGIVNNLPVEILDSKNIIAASALRDITRVINRKAKLFKMDIDKTFIWINYQILQKTIDIMMKQNENRSLTTKWKKITYIHPSFDEIDYYEFHKFKEIIEIGYKEACKVL